LRLGLSNTSWVIGDDGDLPGLGQALGISRSPR